ncbi:MAG: outer membrane beta-barrel protein [Acidobacteriota bacterium]|nr:outer membrane beta-barrel protein [Acidobacteriota bacterium]
MKKKAVIFLIGLMLIPVVASAGIFTFRYSYFVPRMSGGENSLWNIEFENTNLKKSDYQSGMFGLAYEYFLNRNFSLVFSLDFYSRDRTGYYRDWSMYAVDDMDFAFPYSQFPGGDDIIHSFKVSQTPLQLSLKVTPLGRQVRFVPYFGGGVGIYFWSVKLAGDMIDFSDPYIYTDPELGEITVYPVYYTYASESKRISIGPNVFAGVMIPLGKQVTLDLNFRYQFLKPAFNDAFVGFESFDLSGYSLVAGINYWF